MMLFDLSIWPYVMQMSVMQIVDVVPVLHAGVFAVRTMNMVVLCMNCGHFRHFISVVGSSIACMTPLVTNREMCSSANA